MDHNVQVTARFSVRDPDTHIPRSHKVTRGMVQCYDAKHAEHVADALMNVFSNTAHMTHDVAYNATAGVMVRDEGKSLFMSNVAIENLLNEYLGKSTRAA